ncbi:hypothetical protein AU14_11360 [Marinobacter similis]|uniref:Uncharacterized protein n=1 Tax=Marinobacter similis TaxID=1420916 RepID=W5YMG7_9GAMM|nr:hypothetical protein AU14_11360 [Marinobacter similis]
MLSPLLAEPAGLPGCQPLAVRLLAKQHDQLMAQSRHVRVQRRLGASTGNSKTDRGLEIGHLGARFTNVGHERWVHGNVGGNALFLDGFLFFWLLGDQRCGQQ